MKAIPIVSIVFVVIQFPIYFLVRHFVLSSTVNGNYHCQDSAWSTFPLGSVETAADASLQTFILPSKAKEDPLDDELSLPGYQLKPLTAETAELCDTVLTAVYENSYSCPSDPSCLECNSADNVAIAEIKSLFRGPDDSKKLDRLERVLSNFGKPRVRQTKLETTTSIEADPIMLLAVTRKNIHLFLNWACSVSSAGVDPTKASLVVAGDEVSFDKLRSLGFVVENSSWVEDHEKRNPSVDSAGVALLLAGNELVQKGYDIIFQDTNSVWLQDIRPFLVAAGKRRDVLTLFSQSDKADGMLNPALAYVTNTRKSRLLMQTLENLKTNKGWNDAILWNSLARHRFMGQLAVRVLPEELFLTSLTEEKLSQNTMFCLGSGPTVEKDLEKLSFWFHRSPCPLFTKEPE